MQSPSLPRCIDCGCVLASDNPGPRCSPCTRSHAEAEAAASSPALAMGLDRAQLAAAWDRGQLPGLAAILDVDLHDALEVAVALGLLPAHLQRRSDQCHLLIDAISAGVVAATDRVGISRWTVRAWRRELGLTST